MAASAATAALLQQLAGGVPLLPPRFHASGPPTRPSGLCTPRPRGRGAAAPGATVAVRPHSRLAAAQVAGATVATALLGTAAGGAAARHRRRAAGNGTVVLVRAAGPGEEVESLASTREVYQLLSAAPGMQKALRLAARLRRAAREGRVLKGGKGIAVETVDKALDALLEKVERQKAAKRLQEEREAQPPKPPSTPRKTPAPPPRPRQPPREADEWAGGAWRGPEEREEEEGRGQQAPEVKEDPDMQRRLPRPISDVPPEVREAVINNKYNYVDRVWQSPDSNNLPRVPPQSQDASLPETAWLRLPHIAVNGMTNTGKSSLINQCLRWNYASKASSKPGRTDSIDFYLVNNRFVLVDLPGYPDPDEVAYLGVSKNWDSHWEDLVLTYLEMCSSGQYDFRLMLQLQDSKRRPSRMCTRFVAEAERLKLPMLLVMTKDDRIKGHEERNYRMTQIKKSLRIEGPHLHYSSKASLPSSRKARKHLHRWMRTAVTAGSREESMEILRNAWSGKGKSGEAKAASASAADEDYGGSAPKAVALGAGVQQEDS